ncbi:S-layer-like y domain-containing protein [Cohnella lubricantis]|uniref:S-layer homology domain-containing protein n=1 Tax=Cohnella lubricantis TaxID=2163172 RepID=A0A841T8L4_9BACL|nr:S-layer homology domain-containing protein [Cohnella lubricantis]MBB6677272.1 S-layer homology domain-containing protein [Cohnella lubricantis]MBP2116916.1 hypothetical protein [Cohnella lubricantis]
MKLRKSSKSMAALIIAVSSMLAASGSVSAFSDIANDPGEQRILDLQKRGIVQGIGGDLFKPAGKVNGAAAVTLIVRGLGLNIDNIRFIKEPEASDYFTKVKNDAPYAQTFIIARMNGLDLPRDIHPSAHVTREQFANWLFQGILTKGDYAFTEQFLLISDADSVTDGYMNSIQKLLISKIAELDGKGNFRPSDVITRSEAAVMLDKAIEFVEKTKPIPELPAESPLSDLKLTSAPYAEGVAKASLTATAPHPGYGLEVSSIVFEGQQATVNYRIRLPDPAALYPQVITTVTAEAYIPAGFTPVLGTLEGMSSPPAASDSAPNGSEAGEPADGAAGNSGSATESASSGSAPLN